jgi:hypothetical protein
MTDRTFPMQECPHRNCDATVIPVRLGPKLESSFVDVEPVDWSNGGRIRVNGHQPDPRYLNAVRLLSAAHAFGLRRLFRLHAETCKGQQKRARQKATSS